MSRFSTPALAAVAARLVRKDGMISSLHTPHALAQLFNHACALMPQNYRRVSLVPIVAEVYVGTTNARGHEAHQDFIIPRAFHLKGFDLQGAALFTQNGCPNLVRLDFGMTIHRLAPWFYVIPRLCPYLTRLKAFSLKYLHRYPADSWLEYTNFGKIGQPELSETKSQRTGVLI
jgi:hypothetical protein